MAVDAGLTNGYAPAGGAEIYFESGGSGRAVVFLHAGVADRRMWDPQCDVFAHRFQMVRYDLRGFGKSAISEAPYAHREDLLSLLNFLSIEKAALVGCSMGGTTAIDFTLEHPEIVSALVLVAAGVSGWNDWSAESFKYWGEIMSLIQKGDVERAREMDAHQWIDGPSRNISRIDPAYRNRARQLHQENFSVKRFLHPEQELRPPAIGRLREINSPTLVVVGDSDHPDLVKLARRLAAEIPAATMATIENAAHLPNLEHPDEFNRIVIDFLTRLLN